MERQRQEFARQESKERREAEQRRLEADNQWRREQTVKEEQ